VKRPRSPRNQAGPHRHSAVKAIPPGQLWPLSFLHTKCGYGARARAEAIRLGLPVFRWQKRAWVYTDDLIEFLRNAGRRQARSTAPDSQQ
jgi:hypothetical protein